MIIRIAHITLALLLFISSSGFVLNKHYCQNELKSTGLFREAETCQHREARDYPMNSCHGKDQQQKDEKDGCCDDETQYIKAEEEQIVQSLQLNLKDIPVLLTAPLVAFNFELPAADSNTLRYLRYKPPIFLNDLPVLFQVFLL